MSNTYCQLLTKKEYGPMRCIDGVILFLPIEGELILQHFTKTKGINDEVYIVNSSDVFTIKNNAKTIMLYINSEWFRQLGYSFFNYKYSTSLIKSIKNLKQLIYQIALNTFDNNLTKYNTDCIEKIVSILANEGSIDIKTAENQYYYSYYGEMKQVLKYINEHIYKKLTLNEISKQLFSSKSSISSQFIHLVNMGFKQYIDTLKIAESMKYLSKSNDTISYISSIMGFSNNSSYTKTFKNYIGVTPNEYRSLDKLHKKFKMNFEAPRKTDIKKSKKLIESKINFYQNNAEYKVLIDEVSAQKRKPFYFILQLNSINELKVLFFENFIDTNTMDNEEFLLYFNFDFCEFETEMSRKELKYILTMLIENRVEFAFKVQSLEYMSQVEKIFYKYKNELNLDSTQVSELRKLITLVFDASKIEIKEIYRFILKIQNKNIKLSYALDISCLINQPVLFKTIESQIKRINFDMLMIDNAQLKSPYLIEDGQHLLVKNILEYQNIRKILNQFDKTNEKVMFLNVENHCFLNNKNDLSNSGPLLIETMLKTSKYFDGIGLNIFHDSKGFNSIHIFDENQFKTILGIILYKLKWMMSNKKVLHDNYIIVDNNQSSTVFVYDWRVIESESNESDYSNAEVLINFKNEAYRKEYLVKIEKVDDQSGNINHIFPRTLRDKYEWPSRLTKEIEQHLHSKIKIEEFDFAESFFKVAIEYNSLRIIDIFKETNKK